MINDNRGELLKLALSDLSLGLQSRKRVVREVILLMCPFLSWKKKRLQSPHLVFNVFFLRAVYKLCLQETQGLRLFCKFDVTRYMVYTFDWTV